MFAKVLGPDDNQIVATVEVIDGDFCLSLKKQLPDYTTYTCNISFGMADEMAESAKEATAYTAINKITYDIANDLCSMTLSTPKAVRRLLKEQTLIFN